MEIQKLLGIPDFLQAKRVVCVQPHPDDNEVGMGGTVSRLRQASCEIAYITVTDGRAGVPDEDTSAGEMIEIRKRERERAGVILGVSDQYALGFADASAYTVQDVVDKLVPLFRTLRPDVVFTVDPWMPYEAHPDHLKTGHAVAQAMLFVNNPSVCREYPVAQVPQIAFYATAYPNRFVDVSAQWSLKIESIRAHESQFGHGDGERVLQYLSHEARRLHAESTGESLEEGRTEAFKVLVTQQLHFFPNAIFS